MDRWDLLAEDLAAAMAAELAGEERGADADRARAEAAAIGWLDRARAAVGSELRLRLVAGEPVVGTLVEVGPDWLRLRRAREDVVVPVWAVVASTGLGPLAQGASSELARRWSLPLVLRALARRRLAVTVQLRDGASLHGTLDRVGADALDLAVHAVGEPRRRRAVREVVVCPLAALLAIAVADDADESGLPDPGA